MPILPRRPRFVGQRPDRVRRGARRRPGREFRPDDVGIHGLERREMLSTMPLPTSGASRALEQSSVTYPTPGGPRERLSLYVPPGPAPAGGRPVIIAIHGGGWRRLGKAGYGDRIASIFVPQGYVVVAPNYALSTPRHPSWPLNLDDVRSVVAWVRSNAGALGIDPNRVAAMGESAGANLAELLGTDPGPSGSGTASTKVNAVISFSGPTNLAALYATSLEAGRRRRSSSAGPRGRCRSAMPRPPRLIMSHPAIRRCSWCTGYRIRSCRSASPRRWPPP